MTPRRFIALTGAFVFAAMPLLAQSTPLVTFTAETVQTAPDQPDRMGTIIKSGQFMRLEFEQNGQPIIQILRPTEGKTFILYPDTRSYFEQDIPAQPEEFLESYTPPCPAEAEAGGLQCTRIGLEMFQTIPVERWHIGTTGDSGQMLILWDPTRKRALRQEMSDGTLVQMSLLDMQVIEGRNAEHWVTEVSRQGEVSLRSEWWYDPELKLILREALPGNTLRRLQNIATGPVDPALFTVPDGWQRLTAQTPPRQE